MNAQSRSLYGSLIILLLLALLPAAAPVTRAAVAGDLAAAVTVSGTVTLSPGSMPASGATYRLAPLDQAGEFDYNRILYASLTDFYGSFSTSLTLEPGRYGVVVYPPNNVDTATILRGVTFDLAAGVTTVNLGTLALPASTKRLSGVVSLGTTPLPGALIYAYKAGVGDFLTATTASDGSYRFGLDPGDWEISVANLQGARWQAVDTAATLVSFAPSATPETKSASFTVQPTTATITGQLVTPDGKPYAPPSGAYRPYIGVSSTSFYAGRFEELDATGTFTIPVAAATYTYYLIIDPQAETRYVSPPAGRVTVSSGTLNLGKISVEPADATLEGVVRSSEGQALQYVTIEATQPGRAERTAQADANGRYLLRLGAGTWTVEVVGATRLGYLADGARQLVDTAAGVTTTADFTLTEAANRISGSLVEAGKPGILSAVRGQAYARDPETGDIVARADIVAGSFTLNAPAGELLVGVDLAAGTPYALLDEEEPEGGSVTLTLLPNDAAISGRVVDQAGRPVTGLAIDVAFVPTDDGGAWQWTTVDTATGAFSAPLRSGSWLLTYELEDASTDFVVPADDAAAISVAPGQTASVDLPLLRLDGVIQGSVLDDAGALLPGQSVYVIGDDYSTSVEATGGTFAIRVPLSRLDGAPATYLLGAEFSCDSVDNCLLADEPITVTPVPIGGAVLSANQNTAVNLSAKKADGVLTLAGELRKGGATVNKQTVNRGTSPSAFPSNISFPTSPQRTDGDGDFTILLGYTGNPVSPLTGSLKVGNDQFPIVAPITPGLLATGNQVIQLPPVQIDPFDGLPPGTAAEFENASGWGATLADGTRVEIPPGAVLLSPSDGTRVRVFVSPTIDIFETAQYTQGTWYGYEIELMAADSNRPISEELLAPARITLRYDGIDMALNQIRQSQLRPVRQADDNWDAAESFALDRVAKRVTFQSRTLGVWALAQERASCSGCIYLPALRR